MRASPGIRVVSSNAVCPHLLLPGAGIILSAALTLNHSEGLYDSITQQWQTNKIPGTTLLRSQDGQCPAHPGRAALALRLRSGFTGGISGGFSDFTGGIFCLQL